MSAQTQRREDASDDDPDGGTTVAVWAVVALVLAMAAGWLLWLHLFHRAGTGRGLW